MKRSLRVTLLTVLLSLTLFTVLVVGGSGYLNMRSTAHELTDDLLAQVGGRVDQHVEDFVKTAHRQTGLLQHLSKSGLLDLNHSQLFANFAYEIVHSLPILSGVYYIRPDGTAVFVMRSPETKRITVREVQHTPDGKGWQFHVSTIEEFRSGKAGVGFTNPGFDVRLMPSFTTATRERQATWSDTYQFFGERGTLSYPGVAYGMPLYNADGSLRGVVGIGFNTYALCDFLKELDDATLGYAFLIEVRADGERKLIAHPNKNAILRDDTVQGQALHAELMPLKDVPDPVVPVLVNLIPKSANLTDPGFHSTHFEVNGVKYLGGYRGLQARDESPHWLIGVVIPEEEVLGDAHSHLRISLFIGAGVLLVASLLSIWTAAQVARPLEALVHDTEAIARLDLQPRPTGHSIIVEVDRLANATEDMKTSLRSFRKYVPADLVGKLMQSGQEAELGGERRRLTIYFSDIANFTTISEAMDPEKLVEHLGEYLQALSEQILLSGGTVDKYIGDAIMAFWGAPQEMPENALAACRAAIRNQQVLARLREKWKQEGKPLFFARIGINTGEVVVGNIGSAARLNYTVIGDAVNLASRLEGLNKFYGTATMISEMTYEEAKDSIIARPLDWVSVKGKSHGVLVFELLGLKGETEASLVELAEMFGKALHAYRGQKWDEAMGGFQRVLARWPNDEPAKEMIRRCEEYRMMPPGADWDGVHHMEEK
jgi:adenylate cyclase